MVVTALVFSSFQRVILRYKTSIKTYSLAFFTLSLFFFLKHRPCLGSDILYRYVTQELIKSIEYFCQICAWLFWPCSYLHLRFTIGGGRGCVNVYLTFRSVRTAAALLHFLSHKPFPFFYNVRVTSVFLLPPIYARTVHLDLMLKISGRNWDQERGHYLG